MTFLPHALVAALLLMAINPLAAGTETPQSLHGRLFTLVVEGRPDPLPLNRLHQWDLRLLDAEGKPLEGATITVDGGMPAHRHGLPTAPTVTETAEPGRYLLEGLRFSMRGTWVLRFRIEAESGSETLTIQLDL